MMKALIVIFPFALAGCASQGSTCLPLKHWTNAQQDEMAAQIDVLPPNSPLVQAFEDYAATRKEIMACQNAMEP